MFNSLHSSMNQELFKKHPCNQVANKKNMKDKASYAQKKENYR